MDEREGNWWSRAWGGVAAIAFALALGGAAFEASVVAPLWALEPPESVAAWARLAARPDSRTFFDPLVAVVAFSTGMAWLSGLLAAGARRWWLTLALGAAGASAFVTVAWILPAEGQLFRPSAQGARDAAATAALAGDWIGAAALRLAALAVGFWAAYRAQLAGMARLRRAASSRAGSGDSAAPSRRARRVTRAEFSFGDEPEDEVTMGHEEPAARALWRKSRPGRRRTAKK